MRRVLVSILLLSAARANASDFWDEVRTPGLGEWRRLVATAQSALASGRADQAIVAAGNAIERLPDRAEPYVIRALARDAAASLDAACADLDQARQLDPDVLSGDRGAAAALIYARHERYPAAADVLHRVLGRLPSGNRRRGLYSLYGDLLMTLGAEHLESAIAAYREARRASRFDPRAAIGLALALFRSGEREESRDLARSIGDRNRLVQLLSQLPMPESERHARQALAHWAAGDAAAARNEWRGVTSGPWLDQAQEASSEPTTPRPRTPRRRPAR